MHQKQWTVAGCSLWIAGLCAFIIGLNLEGPSGSWLTVGGSIAFLIGLGIMGALMIRRKKEEEQ